LQEESITDAHARSVGQRSCTPLGRHASAPISDLLGLVPNQETSKPKPWFTETKPNHVHGFGLVLKPVTMVSNHGFDAVFLFVIFRGQQAHFGLEIVWVATPSIIKAHNLCLLLVVLQESPGEKVSATGNSRIMMAEFDLAVVDLFLRCSSVIEL
jgi:hypothetical protein